MIFYQYNKLLTSLKESFNDVNINLVVNYDNIEIDKLKEYFNYIIDNIIKNNASFNTFKDREINIIKNNILIEVYNKLEEINLTKEKNNIENNLFNYGFNYKLDIILKEEKSDIRKIIESEKESVQNVVYTKKEITEEKKETKPENKTYRSKKSTDITPIKDLVYEVDNINISALVFGTDFFESKSGYKIITLKVTDYTDSMYLKMITKDDEEYGKIKELIKKGNWYQFYGKVQMDNFSNELVFMSRYRDIEQIENKSVNERKDTSEEKRVELHAHTMMSQMDGVNDEIKLLKQAMKWGHKAIAITDHDGCQAFPHVFNEVTGHNKKVSAPFKDKIKELKDKLKEASNEEKVSIEEEIIKTEKEMDNAKFKVLYGTELEVSEDRLDLVVNPTDDELLNQTYVVFDTETTGFNAGLKDQMIEIGAVKIKNGIVIESFDELINPGRHIDAEINNLTGITDFMVQNCDNEENVTKRFKDFIGDLPLVAHNAKFDISMIKMAYYKYNLGEFNNTVLDTMVISQVINKDLKRHSLTALTKNYGIDFEENDGEGDTEKHHHRADYDAEFTGYMFNKMLEQLEKLGIKTFNELQNLPNEQEINRLNREFHANFIAKNRNGLKNMFKLISFASTKYLVKSARIPRRLINEYREDVLVGSGCYNSEVFKTALTKNEEELKKVMEFYDYIEVQPPSNYSHLLVRHDINNMEELKYGLEKIIRCAKELGK